MESSSGKKVGGEPEASKPLLVETEIELRRTTSNVAARKDDFLFSFYL